MPLGRGSRWSAVVLTVRNAIHRIALAAALLLFSAHAFAQPTSRLHTIGWLSPSAPPTKDAPHPEDLQSSLRDLGYVEGRNLKIEYRYANGDLERINTLAGELARLGVEVIVASGEAAAIAAKRATKTIPIVATEMVWDPVKAGLVASLPRPGGNLTGLASEDLWPKRMALLKELVPNVSTIVVIWNSANPANTSCKEQIGAAAPGLSLQVREVDVRDASSVERALTTLAKDPPNALVTCWDSVILASAKSIARFALERRLATLAPLSDYVEAGVLLSLGTSLATQRRGAARYVSKILAGAAPADLAVENSQPKLVINEKTLQSLRLPLPISVQVRVDEVF